MKFKLGFFVFYKIRDENNLRIKHLIINQALNLFLLNFSL